MHKQKRDYSLITHHFMRSLQAFLILFAFACTIPVLKAQIGFPYTILASADTGNTEKKEVVDLWLHYLSAHPDSIRHNPYWNNAEQARFRDFDLARAFLYPYRADELMELYQPTILSVEKVDDMYAIYTRFQTKDVIEGDHRDTDSNTVIKVYAVREEGTWKLQNALSIDTRNWHRKTVGHITYIYPETHHFDMHKAREANAFYTSLADKFELESVGDFEYYIAEDGHQLGKLIGLDFFFSGYTSGMAMSHRKMLFSGNGSEFYPHELAHMLFPNDTLHSMMNEGFATWHGGAMSRTFNERAAILSRAMAENPEVTFVDILTKKWGQQYAAYYTAGAIILAEAYEKEGLSGMKELLASGRSHNELAQAIVRVFHINPNQLNSWWKRVLKKYDMPVVSDL